MKKSGTASLLGVRLLVVAIIVARGAPLAVHASAPNRSGAEVLTETDAPALASSFCDTARLQWGAAGDAVGAAG
jgi:hypothetical protein